MRSNRSIVSGWAALLSLLLVVGCGGTTSKKKTPDNQSDGSRDVDTEKYNRRFRENVRELTNEFEHSGKRDFLGLQSPCEVLEPMLNEEGKIDLKMGVYVELSGEFNVGPKQVFGGADVVLDLYHHQLTVSMFRGNGLTTSAGVGTGIEFAAGFAHGFEKSANDWNGYFATVEIDASLPFLKEFLSANAGTFVSATDLDDSGEIDDVDELDDPGEGMFGGYVAVEASASFDPLLGASPVSGTAERAFWTQNKEATEFLYNRLDGRIFKLFQIDANLVTPEGRPCPRDWKEPGSEQSCVIEFGERGESHVKRGLQTAGALCAVTGGCTVVPLTAPATIHALSIGAVRDSGVNLRKYCQDDGWF